MMDMVGRSVAASLAHAPGPLHDGFPLLPPFTRREIALILLPPLDFGGSLQTDVFLRNLVSPPLIVRVMDIMKVWVEVRYFSYISNIRRQHRSVRSSTFCALPIVTCLTRSRHLSPRFYLFAVTPWNGLDFLSVFRRPLQVKFALGIFIPFNHRDVVSLEIDQTGRELTLAELRAKLGL
jgi:hypothetical protein